jgi:PAS domain S-box-containing protein
MEKAVTFEGPSLVALLAFQNERIVFANSAAATLTGYSINELQSRSWEDFVQLFHQKDRHRIEAWRNVHPETDKVPPYRFFQRSKALRHVIVHEWEGIIEEQPATILELVDVTNSIQLQARQVLTTQIFTTLNLPKVPIHARLTELLSHIRHTLGIESVGIRLRSDETFSMHGSRGPISLFLGPYRMNCEPSFEGKDCICGKILRSELPNLSCFTARGSFVTNHYPTDMTQIDGLSAILTRNRCTREGFASIASIPIRTEGKTLGILHLASHLPEAFPKDSVAFLEGLGELIGLAILQQKTLEELHTIKEEAQFHNRTLHGFLAAMSHEIRSPMNAILGFTELLAEAPIEGKYREYINIVKSRGQDLLVIIDDVLDWACMEANHLPFVDEPFSLRDCIATAVSQVQPRAQEKGLAILVTLKEDLPDLIRGDSQRVHKILVNLLSNSVKLTTMGEIRLTVESTTPQKEEQVRIHFTLKDTGVGIAAEDLNGIFEPFTQVEPHRARGYGGVNLCLNIVRQLVKKMNGEIRVESELRRGTTFDLYIPFGTPIPPINPKVFETLITASPSMTILLADDDVTSRILFGAMLRRDGHTVVEVIDGGMAFASASNMDFDLVLMDMQMPGMDGIAATKAIRAMRDHGNPVLEKRSAVPIVALTAHALREDEEACLAAGMNGYLKKPLQADTLRACLRTYAKEKR